MTLGRSSQFCKDNLIKDLVFSKILNQFLPAKSLNDVDGGLIGGASLNFSDFHSIINAANG